MAERGLGPTLIGIALAAGSGARLLMGSLGGKIADRTARPAIVLSCFLFAAACISLGYLPARGVLVLVLVSVAHAAAQAPITPLADALTLGSARASAGFEYGRVRSFGSAAFIAGVLLSGQLVGRFGLSIVLWLNAGLFAVAAAFAWMLPERVAGTEAVASEAGSLASLLAVPSFMPLMLVAALIGGSHSLHDSFEVIRWRAAGLSAAQCSALWSLSVASELLMFLVFGRRLLERLGADRALMLAAAAGIVRWGTAAMTAWFPIMAVAELLHGVTFALMHLACMDVIARSVPKNVAATAQTFYATGALGLATMVATLASGPLYAALGARSFWTMAAMCLVALPLARALRRPA